MYVKYYMEKESIYLGNIKSKIDWGYARIC